MSLLYRRIFDARQFLSGCSHITNLEVLDIRVNPQVKIAAEEPYGAAAGMSMPDEQKLREKLLKLTQLKCDPQFSVSLLSMKSEVTNIINSCAHQFKSRDS